MGKLRVKLITVGLDEESERVASRLKAQGYNLSALVRALLCNFTKEGKSIHDGKNEADRDGR